MTLHCCVFVLFKRELLYHCNIDMLHMSVCVDGVQKRGDGGRGRAGGRGHGRGGGKCSLIFVALRRKYKWVVLFGELDCVQ